MVDANTPGCTIAQRIDLLAPHPLARLAFSACRVPAANRLGAEGEGFKIAMRTLDVFRTSVAGAALGFAQRALDEALRHALARAMFGKTLADLQLTQAALADMATEIDAARLQTYRAAWRRDRGEPVTQEVAMAKMAATEAAQRAIDKARAAVRRPRRRAGRDYRAPLSRDPRAAHLRGSHRSAETDHRPRTAERGGTAMSATLPRPLQPPGWPAPRGYSNGIVASGRQIYVAGQVGWDAQGHFPSATLAAQVKQALENIRAVLAEAGATPAHVVRLTWYLTSRDEYHAQLKDIGAAYRAVMGKHFPVMSVVQVVALMEAQAKVEIEATAVIADA